MTPEELHWLLDYIQENNSWKALLDNQSDLNTDSYKYMK